ncbi:GNAT family N-acetyltransferase [Rhodanobacter sp. C03]|uniref:GNAT family N-acetyltransferase n=1 Tax=Rhodanobacter sp. C03 TaxID=1945858 RepID=UPI000985A88D|nr:GNAT family N-acetyltransferase [Rhodanobacter sp. C03]OOG59822.1 GNAT family N-acetyltransferase [Rhodanobacter sp. C03]
MTAVVADFPSVELVPVIETERLRLRAHRADDYATCMAIWSDPEVVRYIGGRVFTAEEVWKRLLQYVGLWSLLGYGYWAVEEKDSGRYIGDIGFADFKRDMQPSLQGMLEFGWVLAPQAHGNGYASEAVAAITTWGQAHRPELRVVCIIAPENLPSIRVAEKAGFRLWQQTVYHDSPTLVFTR